VEPLPLTAILALGLLLAFDLVTPEQAVAGFSNTRWESHGKSRSRRHAGRRARRDVLDVLVRQTRRGVLRRRDRLQPADRTAAAPRSLVAGEDSDLIGKTLLETKIGERFDVSVLEIIRDDERITQGIMLTELRQEDLLIVRRKMREIVALRTQRRLLLLTDVELDDAMFEDESNVLVEVQLLPLNLLFGLIASLLVPVFWPY